ncbi:MAG: PIN domain-containing protein [Methylococcaceae bacterium]
MNYFIDTNILIDFFNKKPEAKEKLGQLIEQEHNLYINGLVYVEALRTIHVDKTRIFCESKKFLLTYFEFVEINRDIFDKTVLFSRFCNTKKHIYLSGRCEAIDFIHFVTAKHYQLEMLSNDKGINKTLPPIWNEYLQTK